MGICIFSKNVSNDIGYGGFKRLRQTVANLCPNEIKNHYNYLQENYIHLLYNKEDLKKYDEETERIYSKYRKKGYGKVIDFLYSPDTGATLSYGTAKQLLKAIGDYNDDIIYGYAGWGDDAMRFHHFKEILEDSYKSKKSWGWR